MTFLGLTFLLTASLQCTLYNSLDPHSVSQAFAFYELYPESAEGKKALERARYLLKAPLSLPIENLTTAFHRFPSKTLDEETVALIERLSCHLPNRKLKGYHAQSEQDLITLDPSEIDLSKALLLLQTNDEKEAKNYLALLDLMALQVLSRLPENASCEDKVKEMNRLIFHEMRFRFPPHSIYAKKIDTFTFLPSVMDNHIGVCLGVTTLYLSIAQRIDLPLEIITPPGHIYIRCPTENKVINIETTARGINVPDEQYQTIHVKKNLDPRNIKEVIGMTYINQASVNWEEGQYGQAVCAYEKAMNYLSHDPFTNELLAFSYIVSGQEEKGKDILLSLKEISDLGEDFLAGHINKEGLKAFFMQVDEKRDSILAKQNKLLEVVNKFPHFRSGLEQLAVSYLQLHRPKEAISWLLKYHEVDQSNALIEYYLALLYAEREDFEQAWAFCKNAERNINNKSPKALHELKEELACHLPEPKEEGI